MHKRRAVHRSIVVFDVERFGDHRRTNPNQAAVRDGLYRSVMEAFRRVRIPWRPDDVEDRGDGIFVRLLPDIAKSLLVELLPAALVAELAAHNSTHPDVECIRLRMSLHAGEILYDDHGVTGEAVNWAFRSARPLALPYRCGSRQSLTWTFPRKRFVQNFTSRLRGTSALILRGERHLWTTGTASLVPLPHRRVSHGGAPTDIR
jgi:hypothetical protein